MMLPDQMCIRDRDVTGTGIMGYITIEKIGVELPIYHGTSDGVLDVYKRQPLISPSTRMKPPMRIKKTLRTMTLTRA